MIRAILAGAKTQTRRVLRPQPPKYAPPRITPHGFVARDGKLVFGFVDHHDAVHRCPYGQSGDLLWVRETWLQLDDDHRPCNPGFYPWAGPRGVVYRASSGDTGDNLQARLDYGYKWRSPIHMPKWACRLWLRVVHVGVERLQEITEEDARAEGLLYDASEELWAHWEESWRVGWDAIHHKSGHTWATNPWVWVVTFERARARHLMPADRPC
jgi:hypothetical protein